MRRFHQDEYDIETGLVPMPWGPNTTQDWYPMQAYETHVLPSTVEEPEAMLALHSFIWQEDDHQSFEDYIMEGPHDPYPLVVNRESEEIARQANEEMTGLGTPVQGVISTPFHWPGTTFTDTLQEVALGERTPSAAMNEIQPEMQSKLDQVFQ